VFLLRYASLSSLFFVTTPSPFKVSRYSGKGTVMPEEKLIDPVEVVRDSDGYWYHPGIPDFDEEHETYKVWLDTQG
jgi:hypothetical protein